MSIDFLVNKANLKESLFVQSDIGAHGLAPDDVLLRIEHFAFTSNNVTYAAFGEAMNYWRFFPVQGDQNIDANHWGRIPVWAFAVVEKVGSNLAAKTGTSSLAIGERIYGYLPMSSHVIVKPAQIGPAGFSDGSDHRAALHPVYNQYRRCAADPMYRAGQEAAQMLVQPLFMTAFLIEDFLHDNQYFGADQVILSSASSKTAYSTAHLLKQRKAVKVVGLTSQGNAVFVNGLACYDQVVTYQYLSTLDATKRTVFVDMAGNAGVRQNIHQHFQDALCYSCSVGGTHWDALASSGGGDVLPGPKPTLFFAPAQIKKRSAEWGAQELQQRMGQAWLKFLPKLDDWMHVLEGSGETAVKAVYEAMLEGAGKADQGYVLSLK